MILKIRLLKLRMLILLSAERNRPFGFELPFDVLLYHMIANYDRKINQRTAIHFHIGIRKPPKYLLPFSPLPL